MFQMILSNLPGRWGCCEVSDLWFKTFWPVVTRALLRRPHCHSFMPPVSVGPQRLKNVLVFPAWGVQEHIINVIDKIKHMFVCQVWFMDFFKMSALSFPVWFHRKGIEIYQWKTPLNTPFQLGNTATQLQDYILTSSLCFGRRTIFSFYMYSHCFYAFVQLSSTYRDQSSPPPL